MNRICYRRRSAQAEGQSLVEMAVLLPILLLLLIGAVEVSNLLITQNRISTASRAAAGFGAANFTNNWAMVADSMGMVALNTVTETLVMDADRWDSWAIYGVTNSDGSAFDQFLSNHVYGNNLVVPAGTWTTMEGQVRTDILSELSARGDAANLRVVASVNFHAVDTILGLPIWQWVGLQTIRGLTVMRVDEQPPYEGCAILPIAMYFENYSLYPSDHTGGAAHYPGRDPVELYGAGGLNYPNPIPPYTKANPTNFPYNQPGWPMAEAKTGYLYRMREQEGTGSFGWLAWNNSAQNASDLQASLVFPGNYTNDPNDPDPTKVLYTNARDPDDHDLTVGDWVYTNTGNVSSVSNLIDDYIKTRRKLKIVVFDITEGSGNNKQYRVAGFALIQMVGRKTTGNEKRLEVLFVRWTDSACESSLE